VLNVRSIRCRFGLFTSHLFLPIGVISFIPAIVVGRGWIPYIVVFCCLSLPSIWLLGRIFAGIDFDNSRLVFSNGLREWNLPFSEIDSAGWDMEDGHRSLWGPSVVSISHLGRRITVLASTRSPVGFREREKFLEVLKQNCRWVSKLEPVSIREAVFSRQQSESSQNH
jgi:hypothetical protein